jgi:hypothetical protein
MLYESAEWGERGHPGDPLSTLYSFSTPYAIIPALEADWF